MSHKKAQKRALVFWLISVVVVMSVVSLIFVAPISASTGHSDIANGVYGAFAVFCHQLPERSYFIDGHQIAVCSRCTGIYAGFVLMLLLYPLLRSLKSTDTPAPGWLLFAAIPLAIDFTVNFFGVWQNTHTSRLLTGALLGGAVVFYVVPGIVDLSSRFRHTPPAKEPHATFTLSSPERIASAPSDYSAPERRIP